MEWSVKCEVVRSVKCKGWSVEHATRHVTSEVLRLPRKMTIEISKMLHLPRQVQLGSCGANDAKVLRLPHKTVFDTLSNWNVTKSCSCHAKRHDNLLGNLRKGQVLQLPP